MQLTQCARALQHDDLERGDGTGPIEFWSDFASIAGSMPEPFHDGAKHQIPVFNLDFRMPDRRHCSA